MLSKNQEQLVERCRSDLAETDCANYCDAVLRFVFTANSINQISIPLVCRKTSVQAESAWSILSYLSGARAKLFEIRFVFIDEDDNEHFLETEDVKQLFETKSIAHPVSGDEIFDVDECVSPVFFPTKKLYNLRGESS